MSATAWVKNFVLSHRLTFRLTGWSTERLGLPRSRGFRSRRLEHLKLEHDVMQPHASSAATNITSTCPCDATPSAAEKPASANNLGGSIANPV